MYYDLQFTKHIHRILSNGKLLEDIAISLIKNQQEGKILLD